MNGICSKHQVHDPDCKTCNATTTEKAQRDELTRLRHEIELTELRIALAKLLHVKPLAITKARIKIERDIAREEGRLDAAMTEDFATQLDAIPKRLRDAKRMEIEPLREELAEYERKKRALIAEMESGQQRMRV